MRASILSKRLSSALKPRKKRPCSPTVPYGVLRR